MESFFVEEKYNYTTELPSSESSKIDLTLKLSPCGENPEQKKSLERSSSLVGNGPQWDLSVGSLDRSYSLPTESEKNDNMVRFGELQKMRRAETAKRMLPERQRKLVAANEENSKHDGASHSIQFIAGGTSNEKLDSKKASIQFIAGGTSNEKLDSKKAKSTQESNSVVSNETKEIDTKADVSSKRFKLGNYCSLKGDVMEILRQMPSVTTTGDGPNGKRIEGFLYKYRTGEVCIVCVCHGNFLTPAEFITHAGGKEVANPMKHITVHTSSSF